MTFTIELDLEDDGRWIAEMPTLSGVMCYAKDREEAIARVQALALHVIADRLEHGEAPPEFLSATSRPLEGLAIDDGPARPHCHTEERLDD